MSSRRLWLDKGDTIGSKNLFADSDEQNEKETVETIFQRFASKPPKTPLITMCSNSLVVAQEFILTILLLARHREAYLEDTQPGRMLGDSTDAARLGYSVAFISMALLLVIIYNRHPSGANLQQQSRKSKVRQRFTDAILIGLSLRFLAAVLRTLTASYSSDTVGALANISLILHLLACDYSYANGFDTNVRGNENESTVKTLSSSMRERRPTFKGGTVSLNAAFFGTTLLASRLESNGQVYVFVSSSVIIFALYPAARHEVSRRTRDTSSFGT